MNNTNIKELVVSVLTDAEPIGKEVCGASNETIANTVSLIEEQSPNLFNQFIKWRFCENIFYFFLNLIPSVFLGYAAFYFYDAHKQTGIADYIVLVWIATLINMIVLMANLGCNIKDAIKIKLAPKIYVIGYIARTIKR